MSRSIARIALAGSIGSGKTAVADIYASRLKYKKISIASAIRVEVSQKYDIPMEKLFGETKEEYRHLLIDHGERKRLENKGYWVKKVIDQVKASPNELWIIDDLRFRYEARKLHEADFITIRLEVPQTRILEYLTKLRGLTEDAAYARINDKTELDLRPKDVDYVIPVGKTDAQTYIRTLRVVNSFSHASSFGKEDIG